MSRRLLLGLYPYRWRQRYEEEIGAMLRDGPLTFAVVVDLVRGALDAHLHPELVAASLVASTGSGQIRLVPRSPRGRAVALVALILLGLALFSAYRAQMPGAEAVTLAQVLTAIQDGRVRAVTVEGDRATIVLTDGRTQRATVPNERDNVVGRAVMERNRTNPTQQTELRYSSGSSFTLGYVLLGYLPLLLLLGALILLAARVLARARTPQRYELLARLGDLRDRGVITEDEFQREKRRLLR
jgi:hypothetical protein